MTIRQLVESYDRGAITGHELIVRLLDQVSRSHVDTVMGALPEHLHEEMRRFLEGYRPGEMLTLHGPVPPPENIEIARAWLNAQQRLGIAMP